MNLNKKIIFVVFICLYASAASFAQSQIGDTTSTIDSTNTFTQDSIKTLVDSVSLNDTIIELHQTDSATMATDTTTGAVAMDTCFIPWDSVRFSLNGYLFNITDTFIIEKWEYNEDVHHFDFTEYDSTLQEFHVTHPAFRKRINNTYLGHTGLAIKSNLFFEPNEENGYLFLNSFTPYIKQSKQATYYNVQKPFTKFEYQTGAKDEQNIDIIHTQNVNPYLNVFAQFNSYGGKGFYLDQESKNNTGAFGAAHVRGRFSTHTNYTFGKINVEENGGIIDPYIITDSVPLPSTTETGTRLNEGKNYMKDRQFFFDQKIGFVRSRKADTSTTGAYLFSVQYNYHNQKSFRIYEDEDNAFLNPITGEYELMYENNYSNTNTFDTSSYKTHEHLGRLNLEESPGNWLGFGAYVGAGKHYTTYTYYNKDTLFVNALDKKLESAFFEGGIFRLRPSSLNFLGHIRLYYNGYRQNDVLMKGMIAVKVGQGLLKSTLTAEGKTESKTADYFLVNYRSNHFRWDNKFDKENVTELRGKIDMPNLRTTVGTRYALLFNHIYFNSKGVPQQFDGYFNVFDVYLNNIVSAYNFNLITKVNFQQSGKQDILPLPDWSFYNALYFEYPIVFPTTAGTMKLQLGVDWHYWTAFYAQAYSPATAQFHAQSKQKVGNYPFIGAFLNLEIKRMRIYLKGEHINYSYMNKNGLNNFFMAPNYPTARMVLKYGIAWTFYD